MTKERDVIGEVIAEDRARAVPPSVAQNAAQSVTKLEVVGYCDSDGFLNKHCHGDYSEPVCLVADAEEVIAQLSLAASVSAADANYAERQLAALKPPVISVFEYTNAVGLGSVGDSCHEALINDHKRLSALVAQRDARIFELDASVECLTELQTVIQRENDQLKARQSGGLVLPARANENEGNSYSIMMAMARNQALDEVARLNSSPASAGVPAKGSYQHDPRSAAELSLAGCRCVRFGEGNPHWPCKLHSAASAGGVDERAEFELQAAMRGLDISMFTPPTEKEYRSPETQSEWKGWQARAALTAPAAPNHGEQVRIPDGWSVRPVTDGDARGFIIGAPRFLVVRTNTSVWLDDDDPAHKLLANMLSAQQKEGDV